MDLQWNFVSSFNGGSQIIHIGVRNEDKAEGENGLTTEYAECAEWKNRKWGV